MILKSPKSICFISETKRVERPIQDPSVRYRCYHPGEMLAAKGHRCTVFSAAYFFDSPDFDHDVYIFHRPNSNRPNFRNVLDWLRRTGRTVMADYDDLIFGDEGAALESSAVKNGTLTDEAAIQTFAANLEAMRCFDKIVTSTRPLGEQARLCNPAAEIVVVSNVVPPSVLDIHTKAKTYATQRSPHSIGYFAGTKSHNADFPIVEQVLHRVLAEDKRKTLLVVGPVDLPGSIAALPNVRVASVVNYLRLPGLMTHCATVIAPLEETRFNQCKSRVKYLESALSGCRLVATPIPDMLDVGLGRLTPAKNLDEWYDALTAEIPREMKLSSTEDNFLHLKSLCQIEELERIGDFL